MLSSLNSDLKVSKDVTLILLNNSLFWVSNIVTSVNYVLCYSFFSADFLKVFFLGMWTLVNWNLMSNVIAYVPVAC